MHKYSLIIEDEACWGCKTCEAACMQEFEFKNKFLEVTEEGCTLPDHAPGYLYRVNVCRHCDDPACLEACPEGAISKKEYGIVILDQKACSGCAACLVACPYHAITLNEENGKAAKCNLCYHRVIKGLYPACADNVCLAHCIYFGDPVVIQATIDKKRAKRQVRY